MDDTEFTMLLSESSLGAPHVQPVLDADGVHLRAAALLVTEADLGATSFVQRHLGLHFSEAKHLMDRLEAAGIVGPAVGSRARDVLVTAKEAMVLLAALEDRRPT